MQILHWKSGEFPEFCLVLLPPILNRFNCFGVLSVLMSNRVTIFIWAFLATFCLKGLYYHALFRRLTFSCFRSIGNFFMGFFFLYSFFLWFSWYVSLLVSRRFGGHLVTRFVVFSTFLLKLFPRNRWQQQPIVSGRRCLFLYISTSFFHLSTVHLLNNVLFYHKITRLKFPQILVFKMCQKSLKMAEK